jgi:hypothetical protein
MYTDLQVWLEHFQYHANHRCELPCVKPNVLTAREKQLIADSLATFQLGEQSEGRSLLEAARRYETRQRVAPLAKIVSLLIAEEQHHAALIGAFMDQQGLPRKQTDWTDRAFRILRRLAGLEIQVSVLIAAELIGKVYYRALEAATDCRQLKALCRIIVADELAHVGFESELLREMHAQKRPFLRAAVSFVHRTFFRGVSIVVWATHRPVLKAAGYRMRTFLRACDAQYSFYLEPPPATVESFAAMRAAQVRPEQAV